MKQANHQADGKNNRAAQSKQARKSAVPTSATTAAGLSARRVPLSAEQAKAEAEICAWLRRQPREELENTARGFFHATPESSDQAFQEITRAELNAVVRFCMKLVRIPTNGAFTPRTVSEEQLDRLSQVERRLIEHGQRADGLFGLLASHLEKQAEMEVTGLALSSDEVIGIMFLSGDITGGISECQKELGNLNHELGRGELARVKLAEMDAERAKTAAKGGVL